MTDRELLELAAKAAGYADAEYQDWPAMLERSGYRSAMWSATLHDEQGSGYWNPLADDGQALRLAVAAGLFGNSALWHELSEAKTAEQVRELFVRAAAEIGKGTP